MNLRSNKLNFISPSRNISNSENNPPKITYGVNNYDALTTRRKCVIFKDDLLQFTPKCLHSPNIIPQTKRRFAIKGILRNRNITNLSCKTIKHDILPAIERSDSDDSKDDYLTERSSHFRNIKNIDHIPFDSPMHPNRIKRYDIAHISDNHTNDEARKDNMDENLEQGGYLNSGVSKITPSLQLPDFLKVDKNIFTNKKEEWSIIKSTPQLSLLKLPSIISISNKNNNDLNVIKTQTKAKEIKQFHSEDKGNHHYFSSKFMKDWNYEHEKDERMNEETSQKPIKATPFSCNSSELTLMAIKTKKKRQISDVGYENTNNISSSISNLTLPLFNIKSDRFQTRVPSKSINDYDRMKKVLSLPEYQYHKVNYEMLVSSKILDSENKLIPSINSIQTRLPEKSKVLDQFQKDTYLRKNTSEFLIYRNKTVIKYDIETFILMKYDLSKEFKFECSVACNITKDSVMITGGINPLLTNGASNVYIFNSNTRILKEIEKMMLGRYNHVMLCLNENAYVFGGQAKNNIILKAVEKFDLTQQKWSSLASMKIGRVSAVIVFSYVSSSIFVFGGYGENNKYISDIECYDIKKDKWTSIDIPLNYLNGFSNRLDIIPITCIEYFDWSIRSEEFLILGNQNQNKSLSFNTSERSFNEITIVNDELRNLSNLDYFHQYDNVMYLFTNKEYGYCRMYDILKKTWVHKNFRYIQ